MLNIALIIDALFLGLSNEILVALKPFDEDLFNVLYSFIKRFPQPVCLIAHNGNGFDFPILRYAVQKIGKVCKDHNVFYIFYKFHKDTK